MPIVETDTHYITGIDQGDGPTVLLLHSSGASSRQWKALIQAEHGANRFIAPDFLDYGGTRRIPPGPVTSEAEIDVTLAALHLIPGPVDIVGHSYGGTVALRVARRLGARVRSLTLIEPVAFEFLHMVGEDRLWEEMADVARRHVDLVAENRSAAAADVFMGYWVGSHAWYAMPDPMREQIVETMPKIAAEWQIMLAAKDGPEIFSDLDVPTLMIRGTKTRKPVSKVVDILLETLPNARLEEVAGAGHISPVTHSGDVNRLIMGHIEACRQAAVVQFHLVDHAEVRPRELDSRGKVSD